MYELYESSRDLVEGKNNWNKMFLTLLQSCILEVHIININQSLLLHYLTFLN